MACLLSIGASFAEPGCLPAVGADAGGSTAAAELPVRELSARLARLRPAAAVALTIALTACRLRPDQRADQLRSRALGRPAWPHRARWLGWATMGQLLTSRRAVDLCRVGSALCPSP